MDKETLQESLREADVAIGFLFLIILGILLNYIASIRGRDALCCQICGGTPEEDKLSDKLRCAGSAAIIGALGFYLVLAAKTYRTASCATKPSATRNLWASALVMAASLIRLWDREAAPLEQAAEEDEPI